MNKEDQRVVKQLIGTGNRIADSLAQLVEISSQPLIEIESIPPRCPFCGQVNPTIIVEPTDDKGRIEEFILEAQCSHCDREIYAVPNQWVILETPTEAKIQAEQNRERVNNGRIDNS